MALCWDPIVDAQGRSRESKQTAMYPLPEPQMPAQIAQIVELMRRDRRPYVRSIVAQSEDVRHQHGLG
jgi:hypothetical protein